MVESNFVCLVLHLFQQQMDCHMSNGYILEQMRLGVLWNEQNVRVCVSISAKMSLEILAYWILAKI